MSRHGLTWMGLTWMGLTWIGLARIGIGAAILAGCGSASAQLAGGYGDTVDWTGWARIQPGAGAGLASSWDRSGANQDYNHYEDPEGLVSDDRVVTAATIPGPGILYRFWMPHVSANFQFPVRLFFDGEATPRLDTTSDEILGGSYAYFIGPLVTTFAGGQVCYEPIPFEDSIRIETENRAAPDQRNYYQYAYRLLPPGTAIESWDGTLDAEATQARNAMVTAFDACGAHPAGTSGSAIEIRSGPLSVPAAGSVTVLDLAGPGMIRRLHVAMPGADDSELDGLRLRVLYDGDPEAAIDVPVGSFFGAGHGRPAYCSLPLGTDSPDGFYSYWPMPFRTGVQIELANETSAAIGVEGLVVEHEPGAIDSLLGSLHATYRESVRQPGQLRHTLLSTTGQGHYVGSLLYVEHDVDDFWILEGDDVITVDGSQVLNGTGLEDIYNGGYYYNWVGDPGEEPEGPQPAAAIRPLHGLLRMERDPGAPLVRAEQYRWRIADRVPFAASIEVQVECRYGVVGSRWASVALWYALPSVVTGQSTVRPAASGVRLAQNAPNPVRHHTELRYHLERGGEVLLELLDVRGRRVETLDAGFRGPGWHTVRWSAGRRASGVYVSRLTTGDEVRTRPLVVIR